MMEDLLKEARQRMAKSIEALRQELSRVRTGRAHTGLLEHIMVEYYNNRVPLNQAANINVLDARTLTVSPWDSGTVPAIEKAILDAGLGLNPVVSGNAIRVPLPELNEGRRRELIKMMRADGEKVRISVRNIRRDVKQPCKEMVKEKLMTEDDEYHTEEQLQKITNAHIAEIDELLDKKEKETMEF